MPLSAGERLGPYEILALIGTGGMGVVYRALDTKLRRPVAVKVLSQELADAAARRRFQREAQMASSLNHPHILTVYDAGEIEGRQYLVTEYIEGGTLKDWHKAESRSWRDTVELLVGVADGLATAHQAGILHRDIKPANILITKSGYAKLADFGLAKLSEPPAHAGDATRTLTDELTHQGVVIGTIAYMSPEQASGKALDARSDVFSFAIVLYQMLTGRRPFEGTSHLEILQAIIHGAPNQLPENIPEPVRAVVEKALKKDPADRYQSMREMVADLRRVMRQTTETPAAPVSASPRVRPSGRLMWVAGAIVVLVVAAGVALIVFRSLRPADSAGAQYTQLTNFDSAIDPALSPDGRMLAFVHGTEPGVPSIGAPTEIYVKLLTGGDPVQLTHDGLPSKFGPRFSPDGARITYSTLEDSGWTTWVVPVLGGQESRRFLANAEGLTWIQKRTESGADQPRLLFSYMTGKGITMAIATSTESRSDQRTIFVQDGIMDHFSSLSPDGKQLLLAEMGFNGWQPCRVAPFDGSSKGKKLGPQSAQCTGGAWSPDGKWMYFAADTGSGSHIWRQRFPDGIPEQVTSGTTEEEGVEFTPDGRSFLTSIGTQQSTLWVHLSSGDRQVTSDAYSFNPSFSSDGKKLYYLVRAATSAAIAYGGLWVLDLESMQRQRLLPEFQMEHYSVSRNGQRVLFVSPKDSGRRGVWVATPDGSSAPRQFSSSNALQAFFGAESDIFFAALEKDGTFIYRVKEGSMELRKVIPHAVYFLYGVSPDGKYVAVWVTGPTEETANAVALYPVDGGIPAILCGICAYRSGNPQEVSWSPDGRLLYLALMGGDAVFAVPLRMHQVLPPLPPGGLRSVEEAAALPGAKPFAVPRAIAGPSLSVYAYPKFTAQRNIYRVPAP